MAFLSSPGSANEVDTASIQVSAVSTPVSTVSSHDNTANLSDATVYFQKTSKKITINGSDTARPRNQDNSRKTVIVEDTSSKAIVAIDGAGFDWSYMVDDEVPTNMALMAFSDSKVSDSDEDESKEMVLKSDNVQHKPEQANQPRKGAPQDALKDQGYFDSGCSKHMTENISYLTDFKEHDGGYVACEGGAKGGKITRKGTIRTGKLDFKDMYFVKELQFNIFSVSQMCEKKNSVLFTDTECFVLSPNFKLADESHVLLKVSRKNNMYSFDMKNIVPQKDLTCLLAKATNDESMLWHRRFGHINFKNINKIVKDNLVRGLPSKRFKNDQTCVACLKRKQHKVSFKSKLQNSISQPLFMLHMDLFGPTFVSIIMHKKYCLIITDDFSRFTWVFFLATKDETSRILKSFIKKSIKREYSMARTPQQNGVDEKRNRTLIEAARTMLADSKLPTTFWAKVVSTACYVRNRVLVVKPHFKTPYELFKDQLGKFDEKSDEGIFVGYSITSKAFRVYNIRTKKVEENLHITFLENKPMIAGGGPEWLFDIDALSKSMNYAPVFAGQSSMKTGYSQDYILMPLWKDNSLFDSSFQALDGHIKDKHGPSQASESDNQERPNAETSTKIVNTTRPVNTATPTYADYPNDPFMPDLEDVGIFDDAYDERDEGVYADYNNLETVISVSPIPSTKIHKDHPKEHIIIEVNSAVQTRKMAKQNEAGLISFINKQRRGNHKDFQNCLFACFLSQMEPKKAIRLFLAYASFMDFTVYQMDMKSVFLYGAIEEEVYVSQPSGLVDPEFPDRVRGIINKTLFIKKIKDDILLVQVYVDDIIFGSTKRSLSIEFEQLMHKRFQMNSMGELTFFLGLQVDQQKDGIFLSQDKYVSDILKKFGFSSVKSATTPMETHKPLSKDPNGTYVHVHLYRSTIGSLIYLTSSRPDIMFAVCACSRFQVQPKVSHMHAVKRIFRYLKGQPTLGLWYPKDSPLELIAYSDSDYAGLELKRYLINDGYADLVQHVDKKELAIPGQTATDKELSNPLMAGSLPKTTLPTKFVKLIINHQLGDMTRHKDIFDTPSLTKKVFANMKRVGTGFSREVTSLFDNMLVQAPEEVGILQDDAQPIPIPTEPLTSKPWKKHKPKRKHTKELESETQEINRLCTNLSNKVLDLESEVIDIKSTYKAKIKKLDSRVERLEEENRVLKELKGVHSTVDYDEHVMENEESSKQGKKIADNDADVEINLDKVQAKYKGKAIVIEEPKPLKSQVQIDLDEEVARQLEAELNADINWNVVIEQVKRSERLTNAVMKYQALKRKPLTKAQARRNMIVYLKNMASYKMNYFKGMSYDEIIPLFEKHYNNNQAFLNEMYPLTHFTLEQMVNDVRLEVDDETEMSPELLRLVRRKLNEGGGLLGISGLHKLVLLDQLSAAA
nr:hypothetical protein [Tanacetum cinerariifolium]